ncbi:hypothetical protein EJ06DRAFT_503638 [Trichodelitschia bisporula]|uniref:Alpha/beta-hydrolase n=1 Tax=Trichodelitschia bisporula TaxID=703511 RepID=A0A6G1I8S4_9PEZI|nr:hypothetical protein EJ06DRAFT_503638 [Trichodelitschia bisporula]
MFTRAVVSTVLLFASLINAAPQRTQAKQTSQQGAAQVPQGISRLADGSTMLDATVTVNGLPLRYRVAGPASMFKTASRVQGASAAANATGSMGLNVLLHGDGGQSFFAFPNAPTQANLMGVAVLAPNANLFWGGGSGLQRTNGAAHSAAVAALVKNELPKVLAFDPGNVWFTGVSGGALMLSGFFVPAQMAKFPNAGVLLACGAMPPQVPFVDSANVVANTRIHFQSTVNELQSLQGSIPAAVAAYERVATQAGLGAEEIAARMTVDNSPVGGHCAFDGRGFGSGVKLVADSFSDIMQPGGNGQLPGVGDVRRTVVGNEKLVFGAQRRQRAA